jgi:hypothetical protein
MRTKPEQIVELWKMCRNVDGKFVPIVAHSTGIQYYHNKWTMSPRGHGALTAFRSRACALAAASEYYWRGVLFRCKAVRGGTTRMWSKECIIGGQFDKLVVPINTRGISLPEGTVLCKKLMLCGPGQFIDCFSPWRD